MHIEYFAQIGEIYKENRISGGGGGGTSIKGAVAGQVIAGSVGAIIGSRNKNKEVKSELITHDTRETIINYFDENNMRCTLYFDTKAFQIFKDLIPEKEYAIVNAINSSQLVAEQKSNSEYKNIVQQIRELAKLKDEGIITDEEFSSKKKLLLDKIT